MRSEVRHVVGADRHRHSGTRPAWARAHWHDRRRLIKKCGLFGAPAGLSTANLVYIFFSANFEPVCRLGVPFGSLLELRTLRRLPFCLLCRRACTTGTTGAMIWSPIPKLCRHGTRSCTRCTHVFTHASHTVAHQHAHMHPALACKTVASERGDDQGTRSHSAR